MVLTALFVETVMMVNDEKTTNAAAKAGINFRNIICNYKGGGFSKLRNYDLLILIYIDCSLDYIYIVNSSISHNLNFSKMSTQILEGYSTKEKTAYVTAIASIATADQSASEQEIEYLSNLAEVAGLGEAEQQQIASAASDTTGSELRGALNILKTSELRFSLIADLIAFAESDNNFVEQEKTHIATIANYLGINENQLEALSAYVKEAATQPAEAMGFSSSVGQEATGFSSDVNHGATGFGSMFGNSGVSEKLQSSGINIGSLAKGLISFVGPMIMGNMLNKGLQGSKATAGLNTGGGGLGDLLGGGGGGIGGALGGLLGGNSQPGAAGGGGGLGSLIGSLSGGKGFGGIGGFLSNLLK